jgi:aminoglycoside phosphotransferase family enzyme/predicted kinase
VSEVDEQRAAFAAWLAERAPAEPVELTETHTSIVAFQGDGVFKLKKAVKLPFVDLSTPELRRRNAEREVRLNRRFSPDVYLGVVEIIDASTGAREPLVEMRRLPQERRLSGLPAENAAPCLARVAEQLARVHAAAERGREIDGVATREAIDALWESELDQTAPYVATLLDPASEDAVRALARRYIAGRRPLFERRIQTGRICDGHGDLLADDVFCLEAGPRVLDCLEFDDRLRWGDGLADAAFLAMDLERLGQAHLAREFLLRYRDAARDDAPDSLADFYIAHRAHVRAKVACIRYSQGRDDRDRDTARELVALARRHLEQGRIRIVLVGGAPGTGKTTVARAICAATGWTLLRSDVIRKELAGLPPEVHAMAALEAGLYTPEHTAQTYNTMIERASRLAALGECLVLDASWADPRRRAAVARAGASAVAQIDAIRCEVPAAVAAARTRQRGGDASDAGPEVARAIADRFAAWPEAVTIDTAAGADEATEAAFGALGISTAGR